MDKRKTDIANVEGKRFPAFLLGMVLALSLLYVGLEYTSFSLPSTPDEGAFDDLAQDMDIRSLAERRELVNAGEAAKAEGAKVKAVDAPKPAAEDIDVKAEGDGDDPEATNASMKTADVEGVEPILPPKADEQPKQMDEVEQLPQFPGGLAALSKWLNDNLSYPQMAQRRKIQGKVVVSFVINTDGTIASPKVETAANPLLDREALRVVRLMPTWKPGQEKGKPCRTLFAIPIVFQL